MFTVKTYLFAQTLDEAYEMLQKNKTNTILGGCGWLKMTNKRIWTAIDLTRLGLDTIEETDEQLRIGAAVSLRRLETCEAMQRLFGGILPQAVRNIVGVQFRNGATVGASVFMRAGYSDLLTALLALETTVVLHQGGEMPLSEFINLPYAKDILTHIIIKKDGRAAAYHSLRNTATDFPVLAAAVGRAGDAWTVSVGARPARAQRAVEAEQLLAQGKLEEAAEAAARELCYGDNLRGSAEYRRMLAKTLVMRAASQLLKEDSAR